MLTAPHKKRARHECKDLLNIFRLRRRRRQLLNLLWRGRESPAGFLNKVSRFRNKTRHINEDLFTFGNNLGYKYCSWLPLLSYYYSPLKYVLKFWLYTLVRTRKTQNAIRSRDALLDLFRVFYFDQRFGRCQFADFRTTSNWYWNSQC